MITGKITDKEVTEFLKKIELGKVYTAKDFPAFKTPDQIKTENEATEDNM